MATPALSWTFKPAVTMIALWIACRGSIACALWMVVTWFDTDDRMRTLYPLLLQPPLLLPYIFIDPLRLKLITHPCQQHFVLICKQPHVLYWDQSQNWSHGQVGWDGVGESYKIYFPSFHLAIILLPFNTLKSSSILDYIAFGMIAVAFSVSCFYIQEFSGYMAQ